MHIPSEAAEALRDKIDESGRWTASTNSDGYPKVKIEGKSHLASHVLLQLEGRPVPEGKVVLHKDNDPKNLELKNMSIGTQQQNLKQMRDEGRDRPRGVPQEPDVKTAAPAWIRETRKALQGGSLSDATAITSRMADAGTRLVKPLSMGGQEAAAGLMAGKSLAGPTATGMQVRKFYKPDSFVANREAMTDVLARKQDAVTHARSLSPQAREMVPDMHGFQELHSGDKLRHISDHEFVPGLRPMSHAETLQHAPTLDREVVNPSILSGRPIGDVPVPSNISPHGYTGNASNLVADAKGAPKMVDFLPSGRGSPVRMTPEGKVIAIDTKAKHTEFVEGAPRVKDGPQRDWGGLMKEVHQPAETFNPTLHFPADNSWGQPLVMPPMPPKPASSAVYTRTEPHFDGTPLAPVGYATQMSLNKTGSEMTVKQSNLYKRADAIDQMGMPNVQDMYRRFAPRTRYQVAQLGSRIGINSPLAAFQNLHMDASARGVPFMQHVNSMAEQQGIQASHLRATPMPRPAPIDIDVDTAFKPTPAPAPTPAAAMPAVPTTSAQVAAVPRPRPNTHPINPPAHALGKVAPKTPLPIPAMPAAAVTHMPTVPRPRGIATALRSLHG